MKKAIIIFGIIIILIIGYFTLFSGSGDVIDNAGDDTQMTDTNNTGDAMGDTATSTDEMVDESETVIGTSVDGRDIHAYHFGNGSTELLFVGGIHGGYSWNTALVAYELVDYLEEKEATLPENIKVTVIPSLNPDGLYEVTGKEGKFSASDISATEEEKVAARFNANDVDLNRNFDCDWQTDAVWKSTPVSGGDEAFSEPEARALRSYVTSHKPAGVVVWYSSAGGVFASNCHGDVLTKTKEMTQTFADASGYRAFEEFDFYEITGDMVNWLAKTNVPAISVLLTDHENTEWTKNQKGVDALIDYFAN